MSQYSCHVWYHRACSEIYAKTWQLSDRQLIQAKIIFNFNQFQDQFLNIKPQMLFLRIKVSQTCVQSKVC